MKYTFKMPEGKHLVYAVDKMGKVKKYKLKSSSARSMKYKSNVVGYKLDEAIK